MKTTLHVREGTVGNVSFVAVSNDYGVPRDLAYTP